jgi:hypothetical protein
MARIIRACAEIEDIITLHLCQLARIGEAESVVLLGRVPVSTKLKMATVIADALGGEAAETHHRCFDSEAFKGLMRCRNTIAHGLLLGLNDEGGLAFRTIDVAGADETALNMNVISFNLEDFAPIAKSAEEAIPALERLLKLQAWRRERRERDLLPHRKSQAKAKRDAKPQPPPQP